MKLRHIALALALAVTGSAFATTTIEKTTVRDTPNGTVTRHVVKVKPHKRHHVKHVVIYRAPVKRHYAVRHHHHRHYAVIRHDHVVVRNS
jgi:hypothetical protein